MSEIQPNGPLTDEQLAAWQALADVRRYSSEARQFVEAVDLLLAEVRRLRGAVDAEREACARLVDQYDPAQEWYYTEGEGSWSEEESATSALPKIAAAIRARGQQ